MGNDLESLPQEERGRETLSNLSDRVAIVTGARRGIGAGIAKALADRGARVVLTDVSNEVTNTAEDIIREGRVAMALKVDVTDTDEVNDAVNRVLTQFGRIDILVNNAGIYPRCELVGMTDEFLRKIFDVNVFGAFRFARAVLPTMKRQRRGKIVNISSVTGPLVADASGGQTSYAATKAALWGFTTALALEVAQYGINVNAVCPGDIDTPGGREQTSESESPDGSLEDVGRTIPFCRLGTPREVGDLVAFLASDESSYITGTHIVIDGGNVLQERYRGPYSLK